MGATGGAVGEAYSIPIEGHFLLYRPLRRLALVGNRALAELALALAAAPAADLPWSASDAAAFLRRVGFLSADPDPPPPPDRQPRPTMAVLLLTNRCQLRCTYCYARGGETTMQDMPLALARSAVDHVFENALAAGKQQFEVSFFGGGEPTLAWATLRSVVAHARSKPLACKVSMITNGVWSRRQRDWITANVDELTLSLDGRQATQDRQRPFASGRGSFRAVARALNALDASPVRYGIRLTATAPWREQLPADVRFLCETSGCRSFQVEPAFNTRRGAHRAPSVAEAEDFVDGFMAAFEIAWQAGRSLAYSGARPWALTRTFCMAPHNAVVIRPDASLVACYEVADPSHPLNDLSTVGHVAGPAIVVDQARRAELLAHLDRKRATCHGCFCFWHCAGDCYTRSYFAATAPDGPNQVRCLINRDLTARLLLWYIMQCDGLWRGERIQPWTGETTGDQAPPGGGEGRDRRGAA